MASGIPGIDRAAMEKERLARLGARTNNAKRLRSISPPATSRPAKQAKTGQNQVHGADDESPIRQGSAESHSKAIEVIALDSTISPLPRKSTSTQQDAHANAQPAKSQLQFPNGVVKKTWAFGHDRNGMDIKLEEVLEKQTLKIGVLSAFQWDTDWVMSKVGLSHSKLIFVMQAKEPELRQQMLRETEDLRKSLRLCFPPMEGQVNCMHSKLMLLFHPQKLRIAVPSANLVKYDWGETGEMENSVFIIDLPRWEEGRGREAKHDTTSFGRELMRFLEKQGLDEDVKQGLLDFDFAATRRYSFVHSIGGASYDQDMQSTGFAGLGAAVREHDLATAHNLELDFAASSIGSLNDEFLCIMHAAARGETPTDHPPKPSSRVTKKAQALPDVRDKVRIYFPTSETVKSSTPGSAGTICLARDWFEKDRFPQSCFRDYRSVRPGLLSHNKILYARGKHGDSGENVAWAYVGSANCSESAWGKRVWDRTKQAWKVNCRNWECGVLIPVLKPGGRATAELIAEEKECVEAKQENPDDVETESEGENESIAKEERVEGKQKAGVVDMSVFAGAVDVPFEVPGALYEGREPWYFKEQ